ncbi:p53 and DNA damage-regulated protein 1 [Neocloeon triangulifer]|uniref:p53 and DNA damage-regulated protein 1 n=1 Tax=Neocloeon triangulifer TaxID=2078957 RepID=UPI00286F8F0A|nr:p53 and DNA damage-regulated protein 1 [Neocloeon triangulifer]
MAGKPDEWPAEFPSELRHLIATNRAAEDVLANRHALIDVDRRRQSMRAASRAIDNNPDQRVTLLTGAVMLNLPKTDVQNILKKDLQELDIESNRIRSELKEKVNLVQELEFKDPLKGYDLKPLSRTEMSAVGQAFGRSARNE